MRRRSRRGAMKAMTNSAGGTVPGRMSVVVPGHAYMLPLSGLAVGLPSEFVRLDFLMKDAGVVLQAGVTNEQVLEVLINRLEYVEGQVPSDFNRAALAFLREALKMLEARTADRERRGVEGTREA